MVHTMMQTYVLDNEDILFNLDALTREDVIQAMANQLQKSGKIQDATAVAAAVLTRELTKGTGLSRGVACPHAKVTDVSEVRLAVAQLKNPVDFEAGDGPSRHIFMILAPKNSEGGPHIKALASIVRCFGNSESIATLNAASNAIDYRHIIQSCHV